MALDTPTRPRIVVGIAGASGAVLGYELLRAFREQDCEIHLVVTPGAVVTFRYETDIPIQDVLGMADHVHRNANMAASIASGSFVTHGMVVAPCSMKTLSAIAHGYAESLLVRAADVCLKEGRKVVLVPREMPLGKVHLKNLVEAADMGCVIVPPMLSFYNRPSTVQDHVDHVIGKVLMQFGFSHQPFSPWEGEEEGGEGLEDA